MSKTKVFMKSVLNELASLELEFVFANNSTFPVLFKVPLFHLKFPETRISFTAATAQIRIGAMKINFQIGKDSNCGCIRRVLLAARPPRHERRPRLPTATATSFCFTL